jgi:CO/xanthine dehydrogenase Mo-binding subunit/aerobic-type carbon monoxide dehydrogenase small subunit (CoxS/CutS family)
MKIKFTLNDKPVAVEAPADITLLKLLRDYLGLTGSKPGCEIGECGVCSVLVEGRLINSCITLAAQVEGRAVTTIEGLHAPDGGPNDLQRAFVEHGAVQCGYCTPGMVMAAEALLRHTLTPTDAEIRQALAGNLCRCTGYQQIVEAIRATARVRRGEGETMRQGDTPISNLPPPASGLPSPICHLQYVGQLAINVDGLDKVMGKARYVGDIHLPEMLHASVLRSPVPHARMVRLNVEPALRVPGVVAAITADDFADHGNWGWPIKDAYILAHQKVRCVGDAIAAVAAETEQAARAGLAAIELELEELPGVFDINRALDADAPLVPLTPPQGRGNVCDTLIVRNGEPEPLIEQCPVQLDETYTLRHQEHAYLETEGALAIPHNDGSVTVYANTQSPFITQSNAAAVLGLQIDKVRVILPPVGGSFGGKDDIGYQSSAQVAALALKAKRPVRLTLTREESMLASYKREAMQIHIRLGAEANGALRAAQVEMLADSGAYSSMTPLAAWRATMHAAGAYRYEAVKVDTQAVYTNNGYSGAFRGFGNTEAVAAIEQAIDEVAHRLGRDPIEFRLQNCLRPGDRAMTGNVISHEFSLADCLRWVRDKSEWTRKRSAIRNPQSEIQRGIGVACYFHGSSLGGEGADYATTTLCIENDCSLTLTSGLTDYGQGSRTVFTLIAAEGLGVRPERIRVLRPDTDTAIDSGPTVASRSTMLGGNATKIAAQKLNQTLLAAAANALRCAPAQIARHGEQYVGPSEEPLSFEQVVDHARQMGLTLSAHGSWRMPHFEWHFDTGTGTPYYCYVFGAQVAEVEVDTRTGAVNVVQIWQAHDGGKIIFPQGAAGQMVGGIAQGVGYALLEEMNFQRGYPQSLNLDGYLIPTALDAPPVEGVFIETPYAPGPYGARNLAEPMLIATAPAIANAVFHATGVRHRNIPMPLEQVLLGHTLNPGGAEKACRAALDPKGFPRL